MESSTDPDEEYRDGMRMAVTNSGPIARADIYKVKAESTPPLNPITIRLKTPVFI